jgi:hypothetical protein
VTNRCRPCREARIPNPYCSCNHVVDITCEHGQEFWVTGDTLDKRTAALDAWPGCSCEVAL